MTMLGKLSQLFHRGPAATPRVALAAFGKHPGWDDHIDDLGLTTPRLAKVKSVLYSQGIAANIDSAGWEQLPESDRLPNFAHEFLWRRAGEAVVGIIWSSTDGKGRAKYPMVLCLQGMGMPISWLCSTGLDRLRALRDQCQAVTSADAVRHAISAAQDELATAARAVPAGNDLPERHLIKRLLAGASDATRQGFVRVLYDMDRRLGALRADTPIKRISKVIDLSAHHFRLPRLPHLGARPAVLEAARAWSAVAMEQIGPGPILSAGILVIDAVQAGHVDLIVGDPTPASLFCIRAAPGREPMTSDIPFNIEEVFVAVARQRVAGWT